MEDRDVFVSWRGVDRDLKDRAVFALRKAGFSVWDSDEDCLSRVSECLEAIATCEVFVIFVSDATMEDSYVDNELTKAHELSQQGKLNMVVYRITDAPMSPGLETHLNNVPDVNRLNRMRGGDPEDGLDALVTRVGMLLERRRAGDPVKPNDVLEPKITGVRLRKPGYFVPGSRDRELAELEKALEESDTVILSSPLPGYGRRSLMRQFARQALEAGKYEEVILLEGFRGGADQVIPSIGFDNINPEAFQNLEPAGLLRRKRELLHRVGKNTLVVVPEVRCGQVTEELRQLWNDPGCKFVLLSRDKGNDWAPWFPVLELGAMEQCHQEALFRHICGIEGEEGLTRFLQDIEGHTRTIEITALALRREKGDLSRFLEGDRSGSLEDRVARQLSIAFEMENFSPKERQLLQIAALVTEPPLETEAFLDILRRCHMGSDADQLTRKLAGDHWLNMSEDGSMVHTESLLRRAYLADRPGEKLVERCAEALSVMLMEGFTGISPGRLMGAMERLAVFLEGIGAAEPARLMMFCCGLGEGRTRPGGATIREAGELCDRIRKRYEEEGKELRRESPVLYKLYGMICSLVEPFLVATMPTISVQRREVRVEVPKVGLLPVLKQLLNPKTDWVLRECVNDAVIATMEGGLPAMNRARLRLLERLAVTKEQKLLPEAYCALVSLVSRMAQEYLKVGLNYGALELCRETCEVPGLFEHLHPVYGYYLRSAAVSILTDLLRFDEEIFDHYEYILEHFGQIRKELPANVELTRSQVLKNLLRAQIRGEALTAARRTLARFGRGDREDDWILCGTELTEALLKRGRFGEAREVLQGMEASPLYPLAGNNDQLQDLMEMRRAMESPEQPELFGDGNEDYRNYYDTFLPEDRRRLPAKYGELAKKAQDYDLSGLTDEQLLERADRLRSRANMGAASQALLPEAFALVSEAGFRVLGYRHHYVQLLGGAVMADGQIAEILNGEGKTYTILLPAFLHSLYGKTVWILDESIYLTARNYRWMAGVLRQLGVRVSLLLDQKESPSEEGSVCYATLAAAGLLQMNRKSRQDFREGSKFWGFAILDEVDNKMMLDCGEYLSVREDGYRELEPICKVCALALKLNREKHCTLPRSGFPQFDREGQGLIEELARAEGISNVQEMQWQVGFALLGLIYHRRNVDYFIRDGRVWREDTVTGGLVAVRTEYEVAVCMREHLPIRKVVMAKKLTVDKMPVREFLASFGGVCGTTATASEHRKFFETFYGLKVWAIPPNIPVMRKDHLARFFGTEEAKNRAIAELVGRIHETGRPVLIVAEKVEQADGLCRDLTAVGVPFEKLDVRNDGEKAERLACAGLKGSVLVATAMVNRGVDIRLGGDPRWMARQELLEEGCSEERLDDAIYGPLDQDEQQKKLRRRFQTRAVTLQAQLRRSREELEKLGGLCVIGACCFEDLRVEQQVRGRAGRQGAPGETWVFYSSEDETLYKIVGERLQVFRAMIEDDYIQAGGLLGKSIRTARERMRDQKFQQIRERIQWEDCLTRSRNRMLEIAAQYRELAPEQRFDRFMKEARKAGAFRDGDRPWKVALEEELRQGRKDGLAAFARVTGHSAEALLQANRAAFFSGLGFVMEGNWHKIVTQAVDLEGKCREDDRLGLRNYAAELSVLTEKLLYEAVGEALTLAPNRP